MVRDGLEARRQRTHAVKELFQDSRRQANKVIVQFEHVLVSTFGWSHHCICLPAPRLPITEDGSVVSAHASVDDGFSNGGVHFILCGVLATPSIKLEAAIASSHEDLLTRCTAHIHATLGSLVWVIADAQIDLDRCEAHIVLRILLQTRTVALCESISLAGHDLGFEAIVH